MYAFLRPATIRPDGAAQFFHYASRLSFPSISLSFFLTTGILLSSRIAEVDTNRVVRYDEDHPLLCKTERPAAHIAVSIFLGHPTHTTHPGAT